MAAAIRTGFRICDSLLAQRCAIQHMTVRTRVKTRHKPTIPTRRLNPALPVFVGQISNHDTNSPQYFRAKVPAIPLTPEGTDYKPSPLHVVWRIKRLNGEPYWLKNIMIQLGLVEINMNYVIVKNTPKNNQMLWHVKHLVTIKPLTFPNGIPKEEDLGHTSINHLGQMIIDKRISVDRKEMESWEPPRTMMDRDTLRRHLRLRWITAWET